MKARMYSGYIKQSIWSVSEYLAYPLMVLLATPIYLKSIGVEQYGLWMFLVTLTGFGGLANGGVAAATIKEVSACRGRNDIQAVDKVAGVSLALSLMVSAIFVMVFMAVGFYGAESWFSRMGSSEDVKMVILIAAFLIVLDQCDGVYSGVLRGMERYDLAARLEILSKFVTVLSCVLAAIITKNLWSVFAAIVFFSIIRTSVKAFYVSKLLEKMFVAPCWESELARKIFQFGKWSWVQTAAGFLLSVGDRLLIGAFLGASSLAQYSILLQLAQQIHTIPSAAMALIFPVISRKTQGKLVQIDLKRLAAIVIAINVTIALLISLSLYLLGGWVVSKWVGLVYTPELSDSFSFLIVAFFVLSVNIAPHYILYGLGRSKGVALVNLVGGVLYFIVGVYLIQISGIVGAAEAKIIYGLVTSLNFLLLYRMIR